MYTRLKEVKEIKHVDVLILGSSHAFRGYDTRIFEKNGIHAFNLGSSSQSPLQTEVLLDRYLDGLNPSLVIYDVYPVFFTVDGVESALNIIGCDKNDQNSINMAVTINHLQVYNTLFYGFFQDKFNLNARYDEPLRKDGDTYIPGGFVEREVYHYHPEHFSERKYNYNQKQLNAFERIISKFHDKQIKYVLVNAPTTRVLYESNTDNDSFDDMIVKYGKYYDFNKLISLNDSLDFYDADHLNQLGVEKFNEKLLEVLSEENDLTSY